MDSGEDCQEGWDKSAEGSTDNTSKTCHDTKN